MTLLRGFCTNPEQNKVSSVMSLPFQASQTPNEAGIMTTHAPNNNPHRKFFCFFSFKKRRNIKLKLTKKF